jgi:hypothetical protein
MGINYIIARECSLNPRMWWVTEMRDVREGSDYDEQSVGDHSFITVDIKGKNHILDTFYNILAEADFQLGRIIIFREAAVVGKIQTVRYYKTLTELSEDEYTSRMDMHQSPAYGKEVLTAGQVVTLSDKRITLQYSPEEQQLASFIIFSLSDNILEKTVNHDEVYALIADVTRVGQWLFKEGQVTTYYSQNAGWLLEQHELKTNVVSLPYNVVKEYIDHLQTASLFFGVRSPLDKLRLKNKITYFEKRGFSPIGQITRQNGVNPTRHELLLEEIVKGMISFGCEPDKALPSIHQHASYAVQSLAARNEQNPFGFLYSDAERESFVQDFLDLIETKYMGVASQMWQIELAKSGLTQNLKRKQKNLFEMSSSKEFQPIERFLSIMRCRKDNIIGFDAEIDYALFQRDNPLGSVTATQEELFIAYMHLAHCRMIDLSGILGLLEVRQFQPGLKKILATA